MSDDTPFGGIPEKQVIAGSHNVFTHKVVLFFYHEEHEGLEVSFFIYFMSFMVSTQSCNVSAVCADILRETENSKQQKLLRNVCKQYTFLPCRLLNRRAFVRNGVMIAESLGFQNIIGQQKAFSQDMPLPSKNVSTGRLPLSHKLSDKKATVRKGIFIYDQFPDPAPSAVGSTEVFVYKHVTKVGTAIMHKKTFKEHFAAPLKSKLGSTHVQVFRSIISQKTAIPHKKAFIRGNYPDPLPSQIGKEDLPGGFRRDAIMTGQKSPLYDFVRGIVQIDGVKVLFDARG